MHRIKSRYDLIQRRNAKTSQFEWISNNNRVNYTYNGDYTGYPNYYTEDSIPDTFQFSTELTMNNGLKTKYIYNKQKQQIQVESTASNNEKKIIKNLEFSSDFKYKPTKTEISEYASDGSLVRTLYTGTTYTSFGGINTTTQPLTAGQFNDASIKAKYTTSYFYTDTTYPYFVTKKQWYQNDTRLLSESYSYDSLGRIANMTNAKEQTIYYKYYNDSNNNHVVEQNTNLENGKISKTVLLYGSETGYAFPREEISYYTNDQGATTSTKTSKTYHMLFGLVKTETDNANKTTSYTYDKLGRITRVTTPGFTNLDNIYYPVSQVFEYKDDWYFEDYNMSTPYIGINGTGVISHTEYGNNSYNFKYDVYDAYGNLRYEAALNKDNKYITKSAYDYDLMQRVTAAKDAEGNVLTQAYDAWGQVKEGLDASGNLHVNDYDIKNNKVASYLVAKDNITNYRANTSSNTYKEDYHEVTLDQFGRTTERSVYENWPTLSGKLSELYRYDISGNVISYTDPKRNTNEDGFTDTYRYDELNQLTEVKNALNQITNINYTILGGISSVTMKENASSTAPITLYTKSYDELGRLQTKTDPTSQVTNYSYNTIGLNSKTTDRNGSNWSASYDGMNQLTATSLVSADNATSMEHRYNYTNPFGYSQERLLENGLIKSVNNYSYDEFGQISQKNVTGSDIVNSNLNLQYDNNGRIKSIGAGVQNSNYFYTNYSYNKDRLEKVQTNGQQTASTSDSDYALYEYYADGKLKKITYPKLKDNTYLTTEYLYDALGRMTSMSNKKGDKILSKFTYTYDANGNILSINDGQTTKTYNYDKLNRLISIQTPLEKEIVYTYDLRGNRKTSNNSIDLSKIQNISYSYDLENKLKAVKKGTETTAMTYYADGYRAKKTTGANTTSYVYNLAGKVVSAEITKDGSTTRDNYVWGPDRVLAGSKVGGEGYYYLYNGHGDVVQIVDNKGNVVNNYKYDEWGNIQDSKETISNPFKYAGEVYDEETGLYYLRARYYDPTLGRFINEDSFEGQIKNPLSLNLYNYCYNNPMSYIDSSGHNPAVILAVSAYIMKVCSSPDLQVDIQSFTQDLVDRDYVAAAFDAIGILVPGGYGFGQASKGARKAVNKLLDWLGVSWNDYARFFSKSNETGISIKLLYELSSSGVKYNFEDIVAITKRADGKLVWLEKGNEFAGLEHIMSHADDFAAQGISKDKITDFIMYTVENGKVVGYQGQGTGRPIYEVVYDGVTQRVAITIGSNGYIVGANPKSVK